MRERENLVQWVLVVAMVVSGLSCSKPVQRTKALVSIFPIYDLVRSVAGPDADVTLVIAPGRSEHGYVPTPADEQAARGVKLGVMVGLGLDSWLESLVKNASPKARILKVGDRVPTLDDPDDASKLDPHVWMDPARARLIVRQIAEELGRADSTHALAYRERATHLDATLAELDREADARMAKLTRRVFATIHPSFRYFADHYKLEALDLGSAASSNGALAPLASLVRAKGAAGIFREPQGDGRAAEALSQLSGVGLGTLDALGGFEGPATPTTSPPNADAIATDSYTKLLRYDLAELERFMR